MSPDILNAVKWVLCAVLGVFLIMFAGTLFNHSIAIRLDKVIELLRCRR